MPPCYKMYISLSKNKAIKGFVLKTTPCTYTLGKMLSWNWKEDTNKENKTHEAKDKLDESVITNQYCINYFVSVQKKAFLVSFSVCIISPLAHALVLIHNFDHFSGEISSEDICQCILPIVCFNGSRPLPSLKECSSAYVVSPAQ